LDFPFLLTLATGIAQLADAGRILSDPDATDAQKAPAQRQRLAGVAAVTKGSAALATGTLSLTVNAADMGAAAVGAATDLSKALATPGADMAAAGAPSSRGPYWQCWKATRPTRRGNVQTGWQPSIEAA
jgi:hypothetical protein